uniref:Uncharacterized protein n=1 Tax=Strigops habroptila TaxID=2489341 RepID=A0A672UKC0_STRHB
MEQPRPPRGAPGAGEPGRPPPVPPDVRFVTEESFDFGVLSPSDRWGGTGSPIDGDRGMRMRPMPRGAAGGAGARCGARAWRSWCGRPRAWPRSCSAAACPPPAAPPAPQSPRTPRSPRRETFVVKDSPVRALLPTVNARDPPATPRAPDKPRGAPAAPQHPPKPRGAPGATSAPKARGGPPPARQPHSRTPAPPGPSGRPPPSSTLPRAGGAPAPRGEDGAAGGGGSVLPPPMLQFPPRGSPHCRSIEGAPPSAQRRLQTGAPPRPPAGPPEAGGEQRTGGGCHPPRDEAEAQVGFCFNYKRSHHQ